MLQVVNTVRTGYPSSKPKKKLVRCVKKVRKRPRKRIRRSNPKLNAIARYYYVRDLRRKRIGRPPKSLSWNLSGGSFIKHCTLSNKSSNKYALYKNNILRQFYAMNMLLINNLNKQYLKLSEIVLFDTYIVFDYDMLIYFVIWYLTWYGQ